MGINEYHNIQVDLDFVILHNSAMPSGLDVV